MASAALRRWLLRLMPPHVDRSRHRISGDRRTKKHRRGWAARAFLGWAAPSLPTPQLPQPSTPDGATTRANLRSLHFPAVPPTLPHALFVGREDPSCTRSPRTRFHSRDTVAHTHPTQRPPEPQNTKHDTPQPRPAASLGIAHSPEARMTGSGPSCQ
jgi:hypothetical protein